MATTQDRINGLLGDLGIKPPVLVATTAAITLSGEQTIDGVAIVAEDRVLVKDQVDQKTNGTYYCQLSTWVRAPDFDGVRDALQGTLVFVATGTTNARTLWALTTVAPVIGTSNLTFAQNVGLTASAFIQTLLDDANAAAARTTLGAAALAGSSGQSFSVNNLTAAGNVSAVGSYTGVGITLSGNAGITGTANITGTITTAGGIVGATNGSTAASGIVGEYLSSFVPVGSAVALTTGNGKNMTSLALPAGDWNVFGLTNFRMGTTTSVLSFFGGSSLVSDTPDSYQFAHRTAAFVPGNVDMGYSLPFRSYQLAAPTTIYSVALAGFTISTCAAWGFLIARRVR